RQRHACGRSVACQSALNILDPGNLERGRNRRDGPTQVPRPQQRDLIGQFRFKRITSRRLVPSFYQRWNWLLKPRQITVVGRGDERVKREILLALQNSDRVESARRFDAIIDVSRII